MTVTTIDTPAVASRSEHNTIASGGEDAGKWHFRVFISYHRTDVDWKFAKWLQAALEGYRTPSRLVKEGIPSRVGKVFLDEADLAASPDLSADIQEALKGSEFLVVVCSPRTPAARWVNDEILLYRGMGRSNRILACLIKGEPAGSFPSALYVNAEDEQGVRLIQPLAADFRWVNGFGRRAAWRLAKLKLLSTLLGCRFDDLVLREQMRRRQRQMMAAVAAVVFTGFSTIAGWYYFKQWANSSVTRIWSSLEFNNENLGIGEINALWDLATSRAAIRDRFFEGLTENTSSLRKLESRPEPIVRGLGIAPDSPGVKAASRDFLAAMAAQNDPDMIQHIAKALSFLPASLTDEQIAAAVDHVEKVSEEQGTKPFPPVVATLSTVEPAMRSLAQRATAEQAGTAFSSMLDRLLGVKAGTEQAWTLAAACRGLAWRLSQTQAQTELAPILAGYTEKADLLRVRELNQILEVLPAWPNDEQVRALTAITLEKVRNNEHGDPPEILRDTLRPLFAKSFPAGTGQASLGLLLKEFTNAKDGAYLIVLTKALEATPASLTPGQMDIPLAAIFDAIDKSRSQADSELLVEALGSLANKLNSQQASAALGYAIRILGVSSDLGNRTYLLEAIKKLTRSIKAEQATDLFIAAVQNESGGTALNTRVAQLEAMDLLASRLPPNNARDVFPLVYALLPLSLNADADQFEKVQSILRTLVARIDPRDGPEDGFVTRGIRNALNPGQDKKISALFDFRSRAFTNEQTKTGLDYILGFLQPAWDTRASLWSYPAALRLIVENASDRQLELALPALLEAWHIRDNVEAAYVINPGLDLLIEKAPPSLLESNFVAIIEPPGAIYTGGVEKLWGLEGKVGRLASRLVDSQINAVADNALEALRASDDEATLWAIAQAIQTLAGRLDSSRVQRALEAARPELASAGSEGQAIAWAGAVEALLQKQTSMAYLAGMTEVLKYPTVEDGARDYLLQKVRERFPDAPGSELGLAATLEWLELKVGAGPIGRIPERPLLSREQKPENRTWPPADFSRNREETSAIVFRQAGQ
ncbi:toll/interleukin-1 receptor domain-containing protein [Mesorhizobium sp. CA7]|uniref:toll/interleukin-1 receptor domain-containing protein n=1 Tax=Mesorhizobium sp. CA7 TaxID=588501 RepID=UPI001CD035A9|nr:toll/interleukin-1 receptor domain-containing protein [Mesorhizobium sp. CA7]MBZ9814746.1 toll/interleukin-1 receptor domain-containing protein [Mesorhizobium sp. CA7]